MNSSDKGARSELLVVCDLMDKGYQVFRAISPASSCDLLIMKDDLIQRVEVRTAHRSTSKNISVSTPNKERFDILAVVMESAIYYPDHEPGVTLQGTVLRFA